MKFQIPYFVSLLQLEMDCSPEVLVTNLDILLKMFGMNEKKKKSVLLGIRQLEQGSSTAKRFDAVHVYLLCSSAGEEIRRPAHSECCKQDNRDH